MRVPIGIVEAQGELIARERLATCVLEIDGNDVEAIVDACQMAKAIVEKPVMIIAHTVPGKGVDFMENDFHWHGAPPNHEQAKQALHELRTLGGRIRSEHE